MKEKFIFFLFGAVFFLNTQFNVFHLIPQDKFNYSRLEVSETLVIGKLLNSEQGTIFEDGGFTGTYYSDKNTAGRVKVGNEAYKNYIQNKTPPKYAFDPYKTQIGGQAILYSIFDKTLNLDNELNILLFRMFNSLLLSISLTLFLLWIKRKFGIATAITTFALMIPNYWLFLYGKSTWWCSWVYFLPFLYGLFCFENNNAPNFKKYIGVFSGLFFVKFWFTGFEFITVFLISSSIPYLYYLFENKLSFYYKFLVRHFFIVAVPLLLTILFQLYQFYLLTGSFGSGIYHLSDAFGRRSSSQYSYIRSMEYLNTLKKLHLDIITRYLGNSFLNYEMLHIKIPFAVIILAGIICSVYLYLKKIEQKLIRVTWFSVAAPFSWFILFQEHAHIHTHVDFFIWYCPFLVLLILLISLTLNSFFKTLK